MEKHIWKSPLKSSIIEMSFFFIRFLGLEITCLLSEYAILPLCFKWHSWKLIGGQIICISCSVSGLCACPWVCYSFSPSHPFFIYLTQAHFPHILHFSPSSSYFSLAFLPYYLISFSSPSEKFIPHFPPTPLPTYFT